jgi:UDP-N-acetylglucosamine--N-acetylmuramyl-(pentapeptide) pyrophosphoryl-undecaprenol N-acetylglucosamine transferase
MNVFFAGGGTGGHLYPALAIARAMVAANPSVSPFFIGARRGIERDILPESGFPFELLNLHPLYRSRPWLNYRTILGSAASWQSISRIAARTPPAALVATGGYAAGIALGFARWKHIPIVIQEQNSYPGLTVRRFASSAAQIHLGFPEARPRLKLTSRTRVFESGNPIEPPPPLDRRLTHSEAARKWGFEGPDVPTLLVFGGSQGAEGINAAVAKWTAGGSRRMRVIWATGRAHFARYAGLARESVRIVPFISPMSEAYSAADLALTRAGAMTTAELAAWGIPAILVPLPTAAADHQTANARAIAAAGAGVMIPQNQLSAESLESTVTRLLGDTRTLREMREKSLSRSRPDAAQAIAANILELISLK